jgi:hypothetical protein
MRAFARTIPLRDRRRAGEKGRGDLLGRQAANLAQGHRNLCVDTERRMATDEDEPQTIVGKSVFHRRIRRL